MNILLINKFHYPHGGADKYYLELGKLLESKGHNVAYFAMEHPRNIFTRYQKYFVSQVDFSRLALNVDGLRAVCRMFWSFEARKKLRLLIRDFRPDIAHIHNMYHHLSVSVLAELKKQGIPVVMTAHDYKIISPNYGLFSKGTIDECTKPHRYYRAFVSKSIKNSYIASALCVVEAYLIRALQIYRKVVTCYVCPSEFMKQKLAEYGIDKQALVTLPNFVDISTSIDFQSSAHPYFLYVGRLSPEKGVCVLLEAFRDVSYHLKVVGRGDVRLLSAYEGCHNIEFLGYKDGEELERLRKDALALIVPSQSYENCPLTILETYAVARTVIASRIGGIPEIVQDGKTGYLFDPTNVKDLQNKVTLLMNNIPHTREMGKRAYEIARDVYSPEAHYQKLFILYKETIKQKQGL